MKATPIYSINYDFIPTTMSGSKCLWVDTKFPVSNLKIGTKIKFISIDSNLVMPTKSDILVSDIIGTRIILACLRYEDSQNALRYFKPKNDVNMSLWNPLVHGNHWGYATRDLANPNPAADRNWTYGNGKPVLYMVW